MIYLKTFILDLTFIDIANHQFFRIHRILINESLFLIRENKHILKLISSIVICLNFLFKIV